MGDHQDRPVLALLLEALVASALIGTFVVYGYPSISPRPAVEPGEVAGLAMPR
ncbi:MAG TPA: hypothetical protein VIV34_06880 [Pseudolabrys sp.]